MSSGRTMFLREIQCVFGRDNVFSGETMCLREKQFVFGRDNAFSGETMCLREDLRKTILEVWAFRDEPYTN